MKRPLHHRSEPEKPRKPQIVIASLALLFEVRPARKPQKYVKEAFCVRPPMREHYQPVHRKFDRA